MGKQIIGPDLSVITTNMYNERGDLVPALSAYMLDSRRLKVQFSIANFGTDVWHSGDPDNYPQYYTQGRLNNLISLEVTDSASNSIERVMPDFWDIGDIMRLAGYTGPYYESPVWDGFHLSPGWYNPTTENNIDGPNDVAIDHVEFTSDLPDGKYKLWVRIDPANRYGCFREYWVFFDVVQANVLMRSSLKARPH